MTWSSGTNLLLSDDRIVQQNRFSSKKQKSQMVHIQHLGALPMRRWFVY